MKKIDRLPNDNILQFPDFTLVSASAGAGKTHTLILKLIQILISPKIKNNKLENILAITFTKNAAAEMRNRVLEYLKKAYLGDKEKIEHIKEVLDLSQEDLREKCGLMVDNILSNYSSFQVQTIDSFMSRIFRASAIELGYSPTINIEVENQNIFKNVFEEYVNDITIDEEKKQLLEELTEIIFADLKDGGSYIWNPYKHITDKIKSNYDLFKSKSKPIYYDESLLEEIKQTKEKFVLTFNDYYKEINKCIKKDNFELDKNFEKCVENAKRGSIDELFNKKSLFNKPINKSKNKEDIYNYWMNIFSGYQTQLKNICSDYVILKSKSYYIPYLKAHKIFAAEIKKHSRKNNNILLTDVNSEMLQYVNANNVPNIYFYLGEAINHYLIDEFQDTSPAHFGILKPLLEESLSKDGSLFVVGDTKQAIYSFRNADWKIMKELSDKDYFASVKTQKLDLEINYRSYQNIVDFNKTVFHQIIPQVKKNDNKSYELSGLSKYEQKVYDDYKNKGFVEVYIEENDDEEEQLLKHKNKIKEIVKDCLNRGYNYGDIKILAQKNEHVNLICQWISQEQYTFISHSNLDIRNRKVVAFILSVIKFLNSPIDDLSFINIVCSDVFEKIVAPNLSKNQIYKFILKNKNFDKYGLTYKTFRSEYPVLWNEYFERLFAITGYLPLYDLISEIYKQFKLFEIFKDEESALIKLLEIVKSFEDNGNNSISDFIQYSEAENDDDSQWSIDAPKNLNAISVMTIHKAKGLDGKVVVVFISDSNTKKSNIIFKESDDYLEPLHIIADYAKMNNELNTIYQNDIELKDVDTLNMLYVALTRAKEEMYIVCVKNKNENLSQFFPAGNNLFLKQNLQHSIVDNVLLSPLYYSTTHYKAINKVEKKAGLYEISRGNIIHAVLAKIDYLANDLDAQLDKIFKDISIIPTNNLDCRKLKSILKLFLLNPEVSQFFTSQDNRKILVESEFVDTKGRLYRMDRVVIDETNVSVIDFKTGDENDEHIDQINNYKNILKEIYVNHHISGYIAYVDKNILRSVL